MSSGGGGGGGDKELSAEEKNLISQQTQLLRDQRLLLRRQADDQTNLVKIMYDQMGIDITYDDVSGQREERQKLVAERDALVEQRKAGGEDVDKKELGRKISALNERIQTLGSNIQNPKILSMKRRPNDAESLRQQIEMDFLKRTQAALRGELPEDPALVRQIQREEETLREMYRRQLGAGYEASSPFQSAYRDFSGYRTDAYDTSRRNDLAMAMQGAGAAQQMGDRRLAALAGISTLKTGGGNTLGQLAAQYGGPIQMLAQNRQFAYNAGLNEEAARRQQNAALGGAGGALAGAAGGAAIGSMFAGVGAIPGAMVGAALGGTVGSVGGGMFSTAKVKKDITFSAKDYDAEARRKLRDTPVAKWRYEWESERDMPHTGPILEMAPREFRDRRNPDMVSVVDYLGTTHAAIRSLDRDVRSLRQLMGGKRGGL